MKRCLILGTDGRLSADLELLEVARLMYGQSPVTTMALKLVDEDFESFNGFDTTVHLDGERLEPFDTANIAAVVAELHARYGFDSILVLATPIGRMLAPRIAMRLGTGLVADVTGLQRVDDELEMVRPAYSGKLMAGIVNSGPGPTMMSIRENAFPAKTVPRKKPERIVFPFKRRPSGLAFVTSREKPRLADIRESEVLVSGGGGVLEHFSHLQELSEALHGQVSASRRVVDAGVAPRRIQVGQSGKTVSPRLYLALGIDGSTQHMEGLKNVEHLVAVNTNKNAPLCSIADVVVEGDAAEFIDRFLERIKQDTKTGG